VRYYILIFNFLAIAFALQAQDDIMLKSGTVSYITTQNVYVKFESTQAINIGDTLFLKGKDQMIPALVVDNKSSISVVCTPVNSVRLKVTDEISAKKPGTEISPTEMPKTSASLQPRFRANNDAVNYNEQEVIVEDSVPLMEMKKEKAKPEFNQRINGRLSVTSFNTISGSGSSNRMRYTLAMQGDNLGNSRLSMDSYINFQHTIDHWDEVKNNLSSALKVYALSLNYDFNKTTNLTLGRKINPRISSMGAIDGVQFEKAIGDFQIGALVGSRPDYVDYGFNPSLFQYGAYLSHGLNTKNYYMQSTISFVEQRNNSAIDRRFVYFQHSSSIIKNLNLFFSTELSLYEVVSDQPKNTLSLTNLYASLGYRFSKKLNISASYDNRRNIYYYETFKSFIDKLIDEETRQGVRLNASYRLLKNVTWGINTGWRFQKSNMNLSENLNTYLTFGRIPSLDVRTTVTANFLKTNYLDSKIFGIRLSREVIPKIMDADISYRMVDYRYLNYESATHQNIAGIDLSLNIIKKLTLYLDYEGTFDKQNIVYHRFYTKLIKRF